jgi:hypothetical protein
MMSRGVRTASPSGGYSSLTEITSLSYSSSTKRPLPCYRAEFPFLSSSIRR